MTDNEIIKALEAKYKEATDGYYTHLQYGGKGDEHEEKYLEEFGAVLDLINRQKAEIERLKTSNDALRMAIELCKGWEERAKAEAIKEFAERLKETKGFAFGIQGAFITLNSIDNLVKEMVGE